MNSFKIEAESDRERLQEDMDRIHEWSLKWQMSFNAENCCRGITRQIDLS